jgi:adenine-specific DNA-methyltransferase
MELKQVTMKLLLLDGKKRQELIAKDPKSEEIIKPLLRGRDIQKYYPNYQDLWIIYIPWHFPLHKDSNIKGVSDLAEKEFQKQYPFIYQHFLQYKKELTTRK